MYGRALAELAGRATLRLANAPTLPFDFQGLGDNVARYIKQIEQLAEEMRTTTARTNQALDEGIYQAALDPSRFAWPAEAPPAGSALQLRALAQRTGQANGGCRELRGSSANGG